LEAPNKLVGLNFLKTQLLYYAYCRSYFGNMRPWTYPDWPFVPKQLDNVGEGQLLFMLLTHSP